MKLKNLYTCEFCHTDYANKEEAKKCEAAHRKKLKIVNKRYISYKQDKSGFPVTVEIKDENGRTAMYKR